MVARRLRAPALTARRAILAVVALAAFALLFSARIAGEMRDFEVYWTAASRALASAPLYRAEDGHFQFKYLPAFAIVAAPMALVSLDAAKATWFAVSVGLLVALIGLSIRLLPERRRPRWLLTLVLIVAMGKFYGHELVLGQVNLLFAVLVCAGIHALQSGRSGTAAAFVVAAMVVKPYAVLLLPWVALLGGWTAAASVAIGAMCVAAAPVGAYGVTGTVELHRAWWLTVTESTAPNLTNPDNVSVAAFAAKWLEAAGGASLAAMVLVILLLVVAVVVILRGSEVRRRETLEGALLLTLIPLLSPQGWDYVFLVATPAIALIANYDDRLPKGLRVLAWIAIGTIGLSLFDLLGRQRYATFMAWSVITVCFFVVIAALGTLRLRRAA